MFSKRIGIDLGTSRIRVVEDGRGVVLDEPSLVAIATEDHVVVAVGDGATDWIRREPGVHVVRPLRAGMVADAEVTEAMFHYCIARVIGRFTVVRPEVMIATPIDLAPGDREVLCDSAEGGGARLPARLAPRPLAAAFGAEIPVGSTRGHMIVEIGAGHVEAALISRYRMVASAAAPAGGDRLDDAIADYIRRRHNIAIGERTAEQVKFAVGSAVNMGPDQETHVRGRDLLSGLPRTVAVRSSEMVHALQDHVVEIVATVRQVLDQAPEQLRPDIADRGIVLTGGGALLPGLDLLLTYETGVPVFVAEEPLHCVARGAGAALGYARVVERGWLSGDERAREASYERAGAGEPAAAGSEADDTIR